MESIPSGSPVKRLPDPLVALIEMWRKRAEEAWRRYSTVKPESRSRELATWQAYGNAASELEHMLEEMHHG